MGFLFFVIFPFIVTLDARQKAVIRINLYSKLAHNFICKDGMNSTITALAQYGKCIESSVDDNYKDWLDKCWHEVAGVEYPTSRHEWASFYCQHKDPWILKNMADHCFISRWKWNRQNRMYKCMGTVFLERLKACSLDDTIRPELFNYNSKAILNRVTGLKELYIMVSPLPKPTLTLILKKCLGFE